MRNNLLINRLTVLLHDIILIPVAWYGSYWLRFNLEIIPHDSLIQALLLAPYVFILQFLSYTIVGSYRSMWGFASTHDLTKICKAVLLGGFLILFAFYLNGKLKELPRSILPLYLVLLGIGLSSSRFALRLFRDYLRKQTVNSEIPRVLIIGAGSAGEGLARDMLRTHTHKPVAFIDDKTNKQGQEIHGVRIAGRAKDIPEVVKKYKVDSIIFAIPSASGSRMRRILRICDQVGLPVHTLPALNQIISGQVSVDLLRKISLDDLLGRDPVSIEWEKINHELSGKTILVSGAGGSIGSEVCRQICKLKPSKLIAIDHCEYNLFNLEQELWHAFPQLKLEACLINIRDHVAVNKIIKKSQPDTIFHAAAYKHVPMLQNQIREAVANNILGTEILARAAINNNVERFIMVSTDKAVNPENIMGATKRSAEIVCQALNKLKITKFITVRFGNVLGSAGSVVPTFKKQIEAGGPVTVTHPEITRYFMTIPEASQLILQATVLGDGGEIYVLDMGEPIKISALAELMIKMSGKNPGTDIKIKYTQLRPGEKLYEELFYDQEELKPTTHPKIMKARAQDNLISINKYIQLLTSACEQYDIDKINTLLREIVPELSNA